MEWSTVNVTDICIIKNLTTVSLPSLDTAEKSNMTFHFDLSPGQVLIGRDRKTDSEIYKWVITFD